ncbi:hypothetical protein P153DRAFT_396300 [Dothidotthia symphoricarpi CBS 119687]|uniref:BTB domain-containing protein n=1 Tax=Dothidotthia symphoricarpi CBS 119687 TaxID=1392245 RepID=A0A6A6AHQ6_9PLEO|nr:uncharacterized protein P153DRAFT_396300 [Dothidotthia symphoricarpi CBS 119687]KAF2129961.1 hypothetical protein P153DRAFT_396300 [Dothidotthia symphoricarpi CBS 119687]
MADTQPYPTLSFGVIVVIVGEEPKQQKFHIHESLAIERSAFFRKILKDPGKEATEHTIPLPEDDPDIFARYVKILYAGHANLTHASDAEAYTVLGATFVLAEKLQDVKAKNEVIKAIHKVQAAEKNLGAYLQMVSTIYCGTPKASLARCYVMHHLSERRFYGWTILALQEALTELENMSAELVRDLVSYLITTTKSPYSYGHDFEKYLEDENMADTN